MRPKSEHHSLDWASYPSWVKKPKEVALDTWIDEEAKRYTTSSVKMRLVKVYEIYFAVEKNSRSVSTIVEISSGEDKPFG